MEVKKYSHFFTIKKFIHLYEEFYKNKTKDELLKEIKQICKKSDYRLMVVFVENDPVGIAAFHTGRMIYSGKYIQLTSLYVKEEFRSRGAAGHLIKAIEEEGRNLECKNIVLDSFVTNQNSHKSYFREGFEIRAFHFMKDL